MTSLINYTYDNNGNCTKRTKVGSTTVDTTYTWDYHNRLVKAVSGNKTIEYTYDFQNRRIEKATTTTGSTTKQLDYLVYDGDQVDLEISGDSASGIGVSHRYLNAAAIDQVLADGQFNGTTVNPIWLLPDNEGTIRDLVSYDSQYLFTHQVYDSFGELRNSIPLFKLGGAQITTLIGYAGGIYDADLDMVQFRDRWYNPSTGRFMSQDPTGLGPDVNPYRY